MRLPVFCQFLYLLMMTVLVAGCGGNGSKAPVKGKLMADGKPVTEGTLMFAPIAATNAAGGPDSAAPALGPIQTDGTFVVGTNSTSDGAAIGRHLVTYTAPPPPASNWDGYGTPPVRKFSPFEGFVPKEKEIEVKAGQNELTIELMKGS